MNKKLTTIMLAVLVLLIGKVDAATLTQKVGGSYISATLEAGQHVKLNFINQANYTFTNWTVESGNVTIDTTNPNVTFIMPNSDVVIRGNYLEEVATPQNYSITYNANGGTGSMTAQAVTAGQAVNLTTNTFTRNGYAFKGWSTDATATTATYTNGQSITPTASMTLYAVWEQQGTTLSSVATVGAYVTYVPSSTSYTVPTTVSGYTSAQNFNPSSTTSWRVFSNENGNVEIISTDSVGDLYLGGATGYTNAVQTLNDMSRAFVNSAYATSGRSLGYYDETCYTSETNSGSAMTATELANYKTVNTTSYPLNYGLSGFPYIDYQYMSDNTVLANHNMYHSSGYYVWLASRYGSVDGSALAFRVRLMGRTSDDVSFVYVYYVSDGSGSANPSSHGVRPIVSLKSGLTITGGTGTSSDPYVINESNPSQYTVTYNANGGYGEMVPQSVSQGSSITLNTNAYEHHGSYTFKGWATSATATTATYTDGQNITPTADMTLYAVWGTPEYTLTYNANGGSGAPATQTGTTLTISSTTPTYSGHIFLGWSTSSSATSATYTAGGSITLTANTTLYAVWNKVITLTYDANGGSGAPSAQTYTGTSTYTSFTISTAEPTPPAGKAFRGWSKSKYDTTADYKIGAEISSISSDTTLYAVYVTPLSAGDVFTDVDVSAYVTYTPSNTSYTVSTDVSGYESDQIYNPSNTTSWRVFSNDGTNVEIISDESVSKVTTSILTGLYLSGEIGYKNLVQILNDISLAYVNSTYATDGRGLGYSEDELTDVTNYETLNTSTYQLNYNVSGFPYEDSQYNADTLIIGNNGSLKQNNANAWLASRYVTTYSSFSSFGGSYLNKNGGVYPQAALYSAYSDGTNKTSNYSNHIRPIVKLKSGLTVASGDGSPSNPYVLSPAGYTLTYNANNGSGAPDSQTGTTLTISSTEPTRSGYVFMGWSIHNRGSSVDYTSGDSITLTADETLYAVWGQTRTLTYDANGGTGAPASQTITTASSSCTFTINSDTCPTKSGYAFRGWSESSSATVADYKIGASIEISSDTTLYAVYVTPLSSGDSFIGSDVGAYVTYTPSSTSYTVSTDASGDDNEQNFNPSSYTNWRVFSNDGTNVEIISDERVGTLYLRGSTGYVNAVQTLQNMAAAYVNSTYATSARSLGYSEEGLTDVVNYKTIDTSTYPIEYEIDYAAFPYTDTQYSSDCTIIENNKSLRTKEGTVWLASRYVEESGGLRIFGIKYMHIDGDFSSYTSLYVLSETDSSMYPYTSGWSDGVRPIVTLKSGLTVTSGDGSPSNPYVLSPAGYTLTYNANGGSGAPATQTGTTLTISSTTPTRSDYEFLGWSTSSSATSASYQPGVSITLTADTTLYAVWQETIEAPILEAKFLNSEGWYKGTTEKTTITEINIVASYTPTETLVEDPWNADSSDSGSIKCYIEGTKLTIAGNGVSRIKAPVRSNDLFEGFENVVSINGLSMLDTSSVTSMNSMFYGCSSLTNLDLSNFVTSTVTDMSYMFYGCSSLTSLDISNFNTNSVTTMSTMFDSCSNLTSLDLRNFNTSAVTAMRMMFYGCSSLTSLDVSSFNTSAVTDMDYMFQGCSNLISLDLSKFNTNKVTTMYNMFKGCSVLTSLDISNFNTSAVTTMSNMFADCSKLTNLDVSNFDTSSVTSMTFMFDDCSSLTSLNISSFNTSSVTDMCCMFYNCSGLTSLDASNFDTSVVTDMCSMFQGCNNLTSLNVNNFNTSNVTDMNKMFYGCSSLTSLDVSSFNTSAVTDMAAMFGSMQRLQQVTLGVNFSFTGDGSTSCELPTPNSYYITGANGNWYKADGTALTVDEVATETRTGPTTYYAVPSILSSLLVNNVSVGDYITYTPSSTSYTVSTTASGYTSDQSYTPSTTTSWRVLSNSEGNIEIISADSVGDLYLQGSAGYINAVQTLNDMSASFVNSTYATS